MSDSRKRRVQVYLVDLVGKRPVRIEAEEVKTTESGDLVFLLDGIERGRYLKDQYQGYRNVTDEGPPFDPPFVVS